MQWQTQISPQPQEHALSYRLTSLDIKSPDDNPDAFLSPHIPLTATDTLMTTHWLNDIKFNKQGLIPAIAQDADTNEVLMVAWMNHEALTLTVEKNQAVYWSRSRGKLWHKGEISGHTQDVSAIFMDCDADVICLKVHQKGDIACHTGRRSCFYRQLIDGEWVSVTTPLKDPRDIYKNADTTTETDHHTHNDIGTNATPSLITNTTATDSLDNATDVLSALANILHQRKSADAGTSYVASLYHKGLDKILEKVGEEATECILAAKNYDTQPSDKHKKAVISEVADLWFHNLVMLNWFNIAPTDILNELQQRFGVSGHDEKAARSTSSS